MFLIVAIVGFSGLSLGAVASASANGCISHVTADGSLEHPFLIETPANLVCLANNPSDYWGAGLYFVQTADLDMGITGPWATSIGTYDNQFKGNYDGGGFNISGLHHVRTPTDFDGFTTGVGLFGEIASTATLTNVHLVDTSIEITGNGIAQRTGALAGKSEGAISDSTAIGTISITAAGSVNEIGGLVGNQSGGTLRNSSANVSVSVDAISPAGSTGTRALWIGGLVGYSAYGTIDASQSRGDVVVHSSTNATKIGGGIGFARGSSATNIYVGSSVQVIAVTFASEIGGLAGSIDGATLDDSFVASSTNVQAPVGAQTAATKVGSAIGFDNNGRGGDTSDISDIVWNADVVPTGQPGIAVYNAGSTIRAVTAQSASVLKDYSTYSSGVIVSPWSIFDGYERTWDKVWGICSGSTFPFLRGLEPTDPCAVVPAPVITLSSSSLAAGGTISLSGTGFTANSDVRIELHSEPVVLATVQTDSGGVVTTTVTIPAGTPAGVHSLVVFDIASGITSAQEITVLAPTTLAATGISPVSAGGIMALCTLTGMALVLGVKRFHP